MYGLFTNSSLQFFSGDIEKYTEEESEDLPNFTTTTKVAASSGKCRIFLSTMQHDGVYVHQTEFNDICHKIKYYFSNFPIN